MLQSTITRWERSRQVLFCPLCVGGSLDGTLGTRFNDRITGKIEEFATAAKIIHIDNDAASISRNIVVDVPIVADAKKAICSLLEKAEPLSVSEWVNEINDWKKEYPIDMGRSGLTPQMVIKAVNEIFTDAVVTTDVCLVYRPECNFLRYI
ncbi:hypothetical protein D5272_15220 [bacterium D16-76]|nr:hypothetical protein [bacterium D16-76]